MTPLMNECIEVGVSVREMSIPTQLDQKFENVWEKKKLHHHEQCLGLEKLEIKTETKKIGDIHNS